MCMSVSVQIHTQAKGLISLRAEVTDTYKILSFVVRVARSWLWGLNS